jgi:Holliday junction resolvasome RuvABC endonuclease subunit
VIIAGIDPSLTSCGIAILRDGRPVLLTSVGHTGRDGASYDERSRRIVSQARAVMATMMIHPDSLDLPIDLAVIEGPAYDSKFGHSFDRAGLWWGLYSALLARKVPIAVVPPSNLKAWATGKGNARKPVVAEAVRTTWADWRARLTNDDICDALVLAEMGARHLGEQLHFEPRRRHVEALESICWPGVRA